MQKDINEVISDWISDLALKDGGKVFYKATNDAEISQVTYGDLRRLIEMDFDAQNKPPKK